MGSHNQLTTREQDIYDLYSEDLERLTFNSKPIINSMTELANDYSSDFPHVIVRAIEDKIQTAPGGQKLPFLYLLDSILKNHTKPYHELLQQNIVAVFSHVFQNAPRPEAEKIRSSLYKLRLTWTDNYFTLNTLLQLDNKIKTMDPNWPVVPSKKNPPQNIGAQSGGNVQRTPGQSILINPAVFGRQSSSASSSNNVEDSDKVKRYEEELKRKELELMELKMKKEQLELEAMRKDLQDRGDEQQKAVKRPTTTPQQVWNIYHQSIVFLSIMS